METSCSTDAGIEAVAVNPISQDNKDYALSVLRPLHIIEKFCQVYEANENPPHWMMDALYHGFARYLGGKGTMNMEACFKISPSQFNEKPPDNMDEMMESYAMLKYLFGMTHDKTAEVVKLWYDYPHGTDTLAQQFKRVYQKALYGDDWSSRLDKEMTVPARADLFLEKMQKNHPPVFQKLKACKNQFKPRRDYPSFK